MRSMKMADEDVIQSSLFGVFLAEHRARTHTLLSLEASALRGVKECDVQSGTVDLEPVEKGSSTICTSMSGSPDREALRQLDWTQSVAVEDRDVARPCVLRITASRA